MKLEVTFERKMEDLSELEKTYMGGPIDPTSDLEVFVNGERAPTRLEAVLLFTLKVKGDQYVHKLVEEVHKMIEREVKNDHGKK